MDNSHFPPESTMDLSALQGKVTIGEPGDKYEQEADEVAAQVVERINARETPPESPLETIQRKSAIPILGRVQRESVEEMRRKEVQNWLEGSSEFSRRIQRQIIEGSKPNIQTYFETSLNRAKGGGSSLDKAFREKVEPAMGADFSDVKVHSSSDEDKLNKAIQTNSNDQRKRPRSMINRSIEKSVEEMRRKEIQNWLVGRSEFSRRIQRQIIEGSKPNIQTDFEQNLNQAKGGGSPLDKAFRAKVEPAMGADFSEVKVHTSSEADKLSKAIQAKAFTTGKDIFFRQGEYEPGSKGGQELLAHELTHVVQQNDVVQMQRLRPHQYGQAISNFTRHLICDLTSPITLKSKPRYKIGQHGAELWSTGIVFSYRWTKFKLNRTNSKQVFQKTTRKPEIHIPAKALGQYRVEVEVLTNGNFSGIKLGLNQDVVPENNQLTQQLKGTRANYAQTMRELVNDFRQYIIQSANATGNNGITPRFLAAVLFIEVSNRPKEGREDELNDVDDNLRTLAHGGWLLYEQKRVNRSLGVGQIRMSTAAMLTGATPWVDQDRNNREAGREQINNNFQKLDLGIKSMIFTQLRWPKSNIDMAAKLLTNLKNRPNRYQNLNNMRFANNQNAVGVIATEYNSGATNTSAKDAKPSRYGNFTWNIMQNNPIIQAFFPNQ